MARKPKPKKRAPKSKPKKRAPKPKPKKRAPKKPKRAPKPKKAGPHLYLYRRRAARPALLASSLILVVSGALGGERLGLAVAAQDAVSRWLGPVADPSAVSAWSRQWEFRRTPVDADTILPALAEVAPELDVGDRMSLAFGIIDAETGAYVPLSFRSSSMAGALDDARANAARDRAKYQRGDAKAECDDERTTFYEVRVAP